MSDWLPLENLSLRVKNFGNDFLLLRCDSPDGESLPALGEFLYDQKFKFVEEVIATNAEICLKLNQPFSQNALSLLRKIDWKKVSKNKHRSFKAPIFFLEMGGEWQEVQRQTGLSRDGYIEQLLTCRFEVAMFGFLPGFLYLTGLPEELHVARKGTPDKRTVSGAFAIGGKYAGMYSLPSPAGWNVVGLLGVQLLDITNIPPLVLAPGDTLQLQQVSEPQYRKLVSQHISILEYHG